MTSQIGNLFITICDQFAGRIPCSPDKPEETSEIAIRALWLCAWGAPVSAVRAATMPLPELTESQEKALIDLLEQRAAGIPLAYLTKRQSFMGLDLECGPEALIPRRETELLGKTALLKARELLEHPGARRTALDLCTGSGNLACSLAFHEPRITMYASDLSADAVALATANAWLHGLESRFDARTGDLFEPFETDGFHHFFDLIVCNPPYITKAKLPLMPKEISGHEPMMAFDGGPIGLAIITRLLKDAPRFLASYGWLAFEVGLGQGAFLLQRIEKNDAFKNREGIIDSNGDVRCIVAQSAV